MDHAIYTAMGAASQTLNQQAVTASNGERLYAGVPRTAQCAACGAGRRVVPADAYAGDRLHAGCRHDAGQMDYTARPLDVALQQDGWLAVQTADGGEGYTRNGNIRSVPQAS